MQLPFRLSLFLPLWLMSLPAHAQLQVWGDYPPVPRAEAEGVQTGLQDLRQIDPLRALERLNDTQVQIWLKKQNGVTDRVLSRVEGIQALATRLRELDSAEKLQRQHQEKNVSMMSGTTTPLAASHRRPSFKPSKEAPVEFRTKEALFYTYSGADKRIRLIKQNLAIGSEQVIYLANAGERVAQLLVSPDMKKIGMLIAQSDGAMSVRFVRLENGELLPDGIHALVVDEPDDVSLHWNGDSNALLYSRNVHVGEFKKSEIWMHELDKPEKFDRAIIGVDLRASTVQALKLQPSESVSLSSIVGASLVMLSIAPADEGSKRYFYTPQSDLKGLATKWKPIAAQADKLQAVAQVGDALFLLSNKKSQQGEILKLPLSSSATQLQLNEAKELIKSGKEKIRELIATKSHLYWTTEANGVNKLFRFDVNSGATEEVRLPAKGKLSHLAADVATDRLSFELAALDAVVSIYAVDAQGKITDLTPVKPEQTVASSTASSPSKSDVDANKRPSVLHKELSVPLADGSVLRVRLSTQLGVEPGGEHPVLLRVSTIDIPNDDIDAQAWVEQHGIVVDMTLRAPSVKKETKAIDPADDVVSVANFLVTQHYATPKTLVAEELSVGNSALIRAVMKQPALFAAVSIHDVASEMPIEKRKLQAMKPTTSKTPYNDLRAGVAYPAIYLTVNEAATSPPAWMSAKLAAALQILSTNKNKPILLKTFSSTNPDDAIQRTAYRWGFFFWQLGEKKWMLSPSNE